MCVSARCRFVFLVMRVRRVPVEQEMSHVLREFASAGRDRVREQKRNAWDEPMHVLNVAPLFESRQSSPGVSC